MSISLESNLKPQFPSNRNSLDLRSEGAVQSVLTFVRTNKPEAEALVLSRIGEYRAAGRHELDDWHALMWPDSSDAERRTAEMRGEPSIILPSEELVQQQQESTRRYEEGRALLENSDGSFTAAEAEPPSIIFT